MSGAAVFFIGLAFVLGYTWGFDSANRRAIREARALVEAAKKFAENA